MVLSGEAVNMRGCIQNYQTLGIIIVCLLRSDLSSGAICCIHFYCSEFVMISIITTMEHILFNAWVGPNGCFDAQPSPKLYIAPLSFHIYIYMKFHALHNC